MDDTTTEEAQDAAWAEVVKAAVDSAEIEKALLKKRSHDMAMLNERANGILRPMKKRHLEWAERQPTEDLSDERLRKLSRYTDGLPLRPYQRCLKQVPELVNLVSLADAIVVEGGSLPFDLRSIAQTVGGSLFYSPKRFTAVQIAFAEPRCRVLLFHTGRIVGTGATSPTAAKMAVLKAMRSISEATGLQMLIKKFSVINQVSTPLLQPHPPLPVSPSLPLRSLVLPSCMWQVGASTIGSRLDCDRFAATHTSTAHYDRASFVGLAYRPPQESCCSEIYSTGKTNLPGSRRERDLLRSWSRMVRNPSPTHVTKHMLKPSMFVNFSVPSCRGLDRSLSWQLFGRKKNETGTRSRSRPRPSRGIPTTAW